MRGLALGVAGLAVADLERSVAFYTRALGLNQHARDEGRALLGVDGRPLLELLEHPSAAARDPATAGLYHVAFLLPDRAALGHALRRLLAAGARLTGAADHVASEAVYLNDPDGHGLELYADRPREAWFRDGILRLDNLPFDAEGVLAAAERDPDGVERTARTVIGHVHLETHDLEAARRFYAGRLGMEVMVEAERALFMAADGYHHHLAANTWRRRSRPLDGDDGEAAGRVGLLYYTLTFPDAAALRRLATRLEAEPLGAGVHRLRDPSGIEVRLAAAA